MKRLWKYIPPCLSDVMGFQAVMNETDGLGIIDDPGSYKPLNIMGVGGGQAGSMPFGAGGRGGHGGREGFGGRPDFGGHGEGTQGGRPGFGGRPDWGGRGEGGHGGRPGFGGKEGKGGRGGRGNGNGMVIGDQRVTDSGLRNEDIISGTEQKLVQTFENCRSLNPAFVLLSNAPSSSMISSDLESAAAKISELGNIPAANVKIYGDKDYLYGASATFEAIGRLLMEPSAKKARTVNIIGCNVIDWSGDTLDAFVREIEAAGVEVLSKWGAKGLSAETVRAAASASLNLVVNISGMRLAQYMYNEFGTPYLAGAPFGREQLAEFILRMNSMLGAAGVQAAGTSEDRAVIGLDGAADHSAGYDALVIGEQLACNAIRRVLKGSGYQKVRVLSFFEMDKTCMEPGDKKIVSEDDLAELAGADGVRVIFANPDYKPAVKKDIPWVNMPNSGMSVVTRVPQVNMVGDRLDSWITE